MSSEMPQRFKPLKWLVPVAYGAGARRTQKMGEWRWNEPFSLEAPRSTQKGRYIPRCLSDSLVRFHIKPSREQKCVLRGGGGQKWAVEPLEWLDRGYGVSSEMPQGFKPLKWLVPVAAPH